MANLVTTRPAGMTAPVPAPVPAAALPPVAGDVRQYLTFALGSEMFALGILHVKEIIEYGNLTGIPMMPNYIRGVINLRGAVVPVIDLAARFGGRQTDVQHRTCIVIVELRGEELNGARQEIGIVVDAVSEVLEIPAQDIEPPPTFGVRIRADFIAGMGKVDGRFVVILDIQCVLSANEIDALADIGRNIPSPAETAAAHEPGEAP